MSIIQDALKKVENNTSAVRMTQPSIVQPSMRKDPVLSEFKAAPVLNEVEKPDIPKAKSPNRGKSIHTFILSIIQDALKKVENNTSAAKTARPVMQRDPARREFKPAPVLYQSRKPDVPKARSSGRGKSIHTFFLIGAFVLLIGASLAQFPWDTRESSAKGVVSSAIELIAEPFSKVGLLPKSKTYDKTQSIPTLLHKDETQLPSFVLNGIMELTDGPRAVINNLIVGVGDTIDGAVVSKIDKKNVVLKVNDLEISLDIK